MVEFDDLACAVGTVLQNALREKVATAIRDF
jgi:hypothetical protein